MLERPRKCGSAAVWTIPSLALKPTGRRWKCRRFIGLLGSSRVLGCPVGLRARLKMIQAALEPHCNCCSSTPHRLTSRRPRLYELERGSGSRRHLFIDAVTSAFHGGSVSVRLLHDGWMPRTETMETATGGPGFQELDCSCYCQCGRDTWW